MSTAWTVFCQENYDKTTEAKTPQEQRSLLEKLWDALPDEEIRALEEKSKALLEEQKKWEKYPTYQEASEHLNALPMQEKVPFMRPMQSGVKGVFVTCYKEAANVTWTKAWQKVVSEVILNLPNIQKQLDEKHVACMDLNGVVWKQVVPESSRYVLKKLRQECGDHHLVLYVPEHELYVYMCIVREIAEIVWQHCNQ